MAMFYWKTKYVQTLSVLLAKNIDKDFSDVKILIAKDHYSFNYIYWFSNKPSPWLKADENSSKVPTSNTNFSNKIPISESYHKNVTLPETK